MDSYPERISIGFVEKAHGVKGELKIRPLTDYPPRFKELSAVFVELRNGTVDTFDVERALVRDRHVFLKLDGVSDRDEATNLKGSYIQISSENILPLADDEFYYFEVVGFTVLTADGTLLGKVTEVLDLPANEVLVVKSENREYLIPVIDDVIVRLDKKRKEFIINPLEGLL